MTTLQIRIDETLKKEADALFTGLGLDTTTAVRIFLNAAAENGGIPFSVKHRELPSNLRESVFDSRYRRNLDGSYETAEEAVASTFEE